MDSESILHGPGPAAAEPAYELTNSFCRPTIKCLRQCLASRLDMSNLRKLIRRG